LRVVQRLKLQIPESPLRAHFVKTRVKVRQYPDGTMRFSYGRDALDATIKRAFSMKKKAA